MWWTRLVYIFDVLTLSSPRDRDGVQAPLGDVQISNVMPVVDFGDPPIIGAPRRGSDFNCEYPGMTAYKNCHGPESRDCWLESKQNSSDKYDINSNYELLEKIPSGVVRKVSHISFVLFKEDKNINSYVI